MRSICTSLLLFSLVLTTPAWAANHYVLESATGAGTGADWTDAYTTLPATLTRGDTYYIGDGAYVGYTFNDAQSGTTQITIKKATVADHGGEETGWLDSYGDGQATFSSQWVFTTGYWTLDGVTGGGVANSWVNNFGFKITETRDDNAVIIMGFSGTCPSITIRHVDMEGKGSVSTRGGSYSNDGIAVYSCSDTTLSYYWMHGIGRVPHFVSPSGEFVAEHGYVSSYFGSASVHSELAAVYPFWGDPVLGDEWVMGNATFRYSLFTDIQSTGGIMWSTAHNTATYPWNTHPSSTLKVYGNIFYKPAGAVWGEANGVIGGFTGANGEEFRNVSVYNNTFINIDQLSLSNFPTVFANNVASNNLWYNSDAPVFSRFATHDYNHFINSGTTQGEANGTSAASGDPFTDYVNFDFTLSGPTTAGLTLASPYTTDMLGTTRGDDSTWDRGAIEYGAPPVPDTLSSFSVGGAAQGHKTIFIWPAADETSADFGGYHVFCGTSTGVYDSSPVYTITTALAQARHTSTTRAIVAFPVAGTYYCAVTTYNTAGTNGDYSNEVTFTSTGQVARTAASSGP